MTELQRYLAEEVAEDHADGIITRREAMRRLGLLGLGASAATTMLTAFGAAAAQASAPAAEAAQSGDGVRHARGLGRRRDAGDHVHGPPRDAAGRLGAGGQAARLGPRHPREPRPDRPHPQRRGPLRGQRLVRAGHRSALRGGRHGEDRRRGAGRRDPRPGRPDALRRGHEGRRLRAAPPRARQEGRRRSASASAAAWSGACSPRARPRVAAAAPFYGPFPENGDLTKAKAAVLGDLRRPRRPRRGHPARRARGAQEGRAEEPHRGLPAGRPRVLQRHGRALQPARGGRGRPPGVRLVQPVPGLVADGTGRGRRADPARCNSAH